MSRRTFRNLVVIIAALLFLYQPASAQLNVWQQNGPEHGNLWGFLAIAADPTNPNIVYTGTYHTPHGYEGVVYKSTTGGPPWNNSNFGLNFSPILKILIDRSSPNILYAATYLARFEIYKSVDSGATWYPSLTEGYSWAFDISRSDPRVMYAAGDTLRVSHDRGATWGTRQLPNQWEAFRVAVDPYNCEVLLVSICEYYNKEMCNTRLYRSIDGGLSWSQPILDPPGDDGITLLRFDPLRPNVIYVSGDSETQPYLYRSQDAGASWTSRPLPGPIYELEFDPRTPSTMYAVGMLNLSRSTDGGINWTPFTNGIPQFGPGFQQVDFSADGRFIYAATSTGTYKVQVRTDVASTARVSGRVTTLDGRAVRGATVSIIDSLGNQRIVPTNPFGYYAIDGVPTTVTYRAYVTSKMYRFEDRIVTVDENLSDLDFVALTAN